MATIYPADAAGKVQWAKGARVNVHDLLSAGSIATPLPPAPAPVPTPKPVVIEPQPFPDGNWLSVLLSAIANVFTRK
jgi:lysozyme